jgi:Asp-tRNA(Asn)/Glu-tRNA(Gln) amidotransferase A subunit family amidase
MTYEAAHALAWEREHHRSLLSDLLDSILDHGDCVTAQDYDDARAGAAAARASVDDVFGDADVLLTPAAYGEAPPGLERTGDPRFARTWTLLGWPSLSVPGLHGDTGLPIGVQLVGRPGADATVLSAGAWLAAKLSTTDL